MCEKLIYKDSEHCIFSTPLEYYFKGDKKKPEEMKQTCTANWRGYHGTWKIEDGYLYLVSLKDGSCKDEKPIPISKIFKNENAPIKAAWYSGIIRIQKGKVLKYVHMAFESIYEKEIFIKFEKGKIVNEWEVDNIKKYKFKNKRK